LAAKWRDAGIAVGVAERWINGGFADPDVAAAWIEASATMAEAALFLRARPDNDDALEWRYRGFDAGSVAAGSPAGSPCQRPGVGGQVDHAGGGAGVEGCGVLRRQGVYVAGAAHRTSNGAGIREPWVREPLTAVRRLWACH
jgi:hypothetical protein